MNGIYYANRDKEIGIFDAFKINYTHARDNEINDSVGSTYRNTYHAKCFLKKWVIKLYSVKFNKVKKKFTDY